MFTINSEGVVKMRNYLEDLLEECKSDPNQFDKLFPEYLWKTLLEIPEIYGLTRSTNEFKLFLHFYGYPHSSCELYYGQKDWSFFTLTELVTISNEIRKAFDESPIERTIFFKIADVIDKKFDLINVVIEQKFEKPGIMVRNPPIEIGTYIQFMDESESILKNASYPKWNDGKWEYFVL